MASAAFLPAKEGLIDGSIDLDTAVIKVALVQDYDTFTSSHKFMSDITGAGGTVVSTFTLSSVTVANGVFDAADGTFTSVPLGPECTCIIGYQASAVTGGSDVASSSQRLIWFTDDADGLPVTPNGGSIAVSFSNGPSRILALT